MLTPSPCSNIVIYNIGMHPSIVYYIYIYIYIYIPSGVLCSFKGYTHREQRVPALGASTRCQHYASKHYIYIYIYIYIYNYIHILIILLYYIYIYIYIYLYYYNIYIYIII